MRRHFWACGLDASGASSSSVRTILELGLAVVVIGLTIMLYDLTIQDIIEDTNCYTQDMRVLLGLEEN